MALYRAFVNIFKPESLGALYGFVANPGVINDNFLSLVNMAKPNVWLTLFAAGLQFLQAKQTSSYTKGQSQDLNKEMAALNTQMLYFFPILIIIIGWNLPAGLMVYWATTTVLSMAEQAYIKWKYK